MVDGIYQSVMCFFIPYIIVVLTSSAASDGLDVAERTRLGAYIAHPAVFTINMYILINTYRWDWLILLVVAISDLFVFFWTGIYTAFTYAGPFYQTAPQVYQELTFWMTLIVTPMVCLLPRLVVKCIQKQGFPYDVDIIREQISQGQFDHLNADKSPATAVEGVQGGSSGSSESSSKTSKKGKHAQYASVDEDRRPIYPPSVATHNTRTQNGSDGTNYTMHNRVSLDMRQEDELTQDAPVRPSIDRARPSYDRIRMSIDRVRPSLEASNDFTSAARLSRIESSHSAHDATSSGQRRFNLNTVRKRGLSAFSKKSLEP
jgi:phospholipid-translocating ATPase